MWHHDKSTLAIEMKSRCGLASGTPPLLLAIGGKNGRPLDNRSFAPGAGNLICRTPNKEINSFIWFRDTPQPITFTFPKWHEGLEKVCSPPMIPFWRGGGRREVSIQSILWDRGFFRVVARRPSCPGTFRVSTLVMVARLSTASFHPFVPLR